MITSDGGLVEIIGINGKRSDIFLHFFVYLYNFEISFQCRIYKIEHRPTIWKCFFECYHDDKCDYFVDVHSHCCYGDFQHTESPATTWTDDVTVYVKNGKPPSFSSSK